MTDSDSQPYWLDKNFIYELLESLPTHVFWKNKEGVYLGCNTIFAKSLGLHSSKDIVGKTDYDLPVKRQDSDAYRLDDQQVMASRQPKLHIEEEQVLSNGRKIYLLTSKVPLFDNENNILGVLGVYSDITDLKKTQLELAQAKQLAEQASDAKSQFIANMSHDLRTPLAGILGMLDGLLFAAEDAQAALVSDEVLSKEAVLKMLKDIVMRTYDYVDIAKNSTHELLALFNQILETVQLESGQIDVANEAFNLRELVTHCVSLLRPMALHKKLDFIVDIDKDLPPYLNAAVLYLGRIMINLVSNALKFTEKGLVRLKINFEDKPKQLLKKGNQFKLKITVEDTGIGIPDDKYEEIFDYFSRLTASYEGIYKGSGLGLYTVKHYVEAMRGTIDVSSNEKKGSCFIITVPVTVDDHAEIKVQESITLNNPKIIEVPEFQEANNFDTSVLLVEDQPAAAMAARLLLERMHCHVDAATSGAKALELINKNDYQLILMDVGLPDMDGMVVTKKIRALDNVVKSHVPIIALTGHIAGDDHQACLDSGMNAVLTKPAQFYDLQLVLQRWVWFNKKGNDEFDTAHLAVIDWDESLSYFNDNSQALQEILGMMVDDMKETKTMLARYYHANDFDALRSLLHRCLGGVAYLKLPRLEYALKAFQSAVKTEDKNPKILEYAYNNLDNAISEFLDAFS